MHAVIIFDIPSDRLQAVKNAMVANGYWNRWLGEDKQTYYLPDNALWKPDCDLKQAKNDLIALTNQLNINLRRCIILSVNPWDGIPGTQ